MCHHALGVKAMPLDILQDLTCEPTTGNACYVYFKLCKKASSYL